MHMAAEANIALANKRNSGPEIHREFAVKLETFIPRVASSAGFSAELYVFPLFGFKQFVNFSQTISEKSLKTFRGVRNHVQNSS